MRKICRVIRRFSEYRVEFPAKLQIMILLKLPVQLHTVHKLGNLRSLVSPALIRVTSESGIVVFITSSQFTKRNIASNGTNTLGAILK